MQDAVQNPAGTYLRRERLVVFLYIFCIMFTLSREIYRRWAALDALWGNAPVSHVAAAPKLYAPDAYRTALPTLQYQVQKAFHVGSTPGFIAAWDFVSGMALLWLLYRLTVHHLAEPKTLQTQRTVAVAVALSAMHFPLLWTLDWIRPNTLTCGLLVALSVWLLTRTARHPAWCVALMLLTVGQAFVRSDYPFFLGLAVVVLAAAGLLREFGSRRYLLAIGAGIVALSGGVQAYLQFVVHPHLTYPPGVPVFMLMINMGRPYMAAFWTAMLPVALVGVGAWTQREYLHSIDWLCLVIPLVYIPLWLTVASAMEVRVFFPMMVLIVPLAGRVAGRFLTRGEPQQVLNA